MYAIIETAGKQFKVEQGGRIRVDTVAQEVGQDITLDRVLLVGNGDQVTVGTPVVAGATVKAQVLAHDRAKKIIVFKKRSKKTYKKTQGHRQNYTELLIKSIEA